MGSLPVSVCLNPSRSRPLSVCQSVSVCLLVCTRYSVSTHHLAEVSVSAGISRFHCMHTSNIKHARTVRACHGINRSLCCGQKMYRVVAPTTSAHFGPIAATNRGIDEYLMPQVTILDFRSVMIASGRLNLKGKGSIESSNTHCLGDPKSGHA